MACLVLGIGVWIGAVDNSSSPRVKNVDSGHKRTIECDEFEVSKIMMCVDGKTQSVIVEFRVDMKGCPADDSCEADWVPDKDGEGGHFEITEVAS